MANTTNFGWETPDDTDLVKDGAAAMRTLGNAIDTSLVDLKGGTSGQILAKNTNTDMDFVWINNDQGDITAVNAGVGITGGGTSGAVTITNAMADAITTKGDLLAGTAADTFARLGAGANGTVLTANSATATGLEWATVAAGGMTVLTSGSHSGATNFTLSGISGSYNDLRLVLRNFKPTADGDGLNININSLGANTHWDGSTLSQPTATSFSLDYWSTGVGNDNTVSNSIFVLHLYDYANTSTWKFANIWFWTNDNSNTAQFTFRYRNAIVNTSNAITSIKPYSGSNFTCDYILYGVK